MIPNETPNRIKAFFNSRRMMKKHGNDAWNLQAAFSSAGDSCD
ncbi:hypothetical protein [Suttonella ornithocola]|nr:hypothetical protein [Suttonella ornithocola]